MAGKTTYGRHLAKLQVQQYKMQEQVAAAVGVTVAEVDAWENNQAVPTQEQLWALVDYLGPEAAPPFAPEPRIRPGYSYRDRSKYDPYKLY